MSWHTRRDTRKIHRWGAILIALPFLIVLISGLILQVKKEVAWVQPPSQEGISTVPSVSFEKILNQVKSVPEADTDSWEDIDRLDVRPDKGIVKVRTLNNYEIQLDTETGEILQVAFRRSDIIEAIHDGSWFHDSAKLWIFLPSGIIVTVLWITGIYLFFLPYAAKRKNRKRLEKLKSS
ncbi:PepSY domain-containing protein [Balneola sp. MJW-20]|uniref:PepSY domain-containing protein n=1 Tax=Gracilimonas aurantiaca TaxID=3234185 RepID=UPI0034678FDE